MKIFRGILLGVLLGVVALYLRYNAVTLFGDAQKVETPLEGAIAVMDNMEQGMVGSELVYENSVDVDDLFLSIEAISPYMVNAKFNFNNYLYKVELESNILDDQIESIEEAERLAKLIAPDSMSIMEKLEAIHDYIVIGSKYDVVAAAQEDVDDVSLSVTGIIDNKTAVCAGYARTFMTMCRAVGIDMVYISDVEMNHGWNALEYYGDIYYVDTTFNDPVPDKSGRALRTYFMVSEEELSKTHTWDKYFYNNLLSEYFHEDYEYIQRLTDIGAITTEITNENANQPVSFDTISNTLKKLDVSHDTEEQSDETYDLNVLNGKDSYTTHEILTFLDLPIEGEEQVATNGFFARIIYQNMI